ncbi:heavy metal translocating P-type ATPase [Aquabacter sp. CN5-332]|uniref:heavy metal translocating P-type ATPase n=1 Tax=Aquabacter sp. CN5-332 TaxID=3156608 RepID=UPI0032B3CA6F
MNAEAADYSIFLAQDASGHAQLNLVVEGIEQPSAIAEIERGLASLPGVIRARLNYTNHRLTVAWSDTAAPGAVVERLSALGYRAHPYAAKAEDGEAERARWLLRCLGVAGFAAMNVMLLSVSVWAGNVSDITPETRDLFHWLSALIALPAAAYAGQPFFLSAIHGLRNRALNMDVPISLGVLLALGMSVVETALSQEHAYFDSALMLLFFLLAGRYLDHAARQRTRAVAANVAALRGEMAHRLDEAAVPVQVPVQALVCGDVILVPPGERIGADGVVVNGASSVSEGLATGETLPRAVTAGSAVHAGSLNGEGALTLRVTAGGEETLVDEVQRLLDTALSSRSAYVRLADRVARAYAPVVHLTALAAAAGWLLAGASFHDAVMIAVAVLIITCPCALALAVPAVQVVATGALFRSGLLLRSADMLERLAQVDMVVFDKTGTLTLPDPVLRLPAGTDESLLPLAARLAVSSRHPLAAILARQAAGAPFADVTEAPGEGVRTLIDGEEARLGSLSFCGLQAPADLPASASFIAFRLGGRGFVAGVDQALRSDAAEVVSAIKARGLKVAIFSGDRPEAVQPVADALGIADARAGLKPAGKIAALEALKAQGHRVLMVGDGLNDAPALAAAHVSLSPVEGAALAKAQADAEFLGTRLAPVLDALDGARRALRRIHENLALALLYNLIAVPLAVGGFVTPLVAALAMSGSSILVTLNALRAKGRPAP